MTTFTKRPCFIAAVTVASFGLAVAVTLASPPDEAFETQIETIMAESAATARKLARQVLPAAEELGPGWRAPWQLPAVAASIVEMYAASEDDYWAQLAAQMPPSGLDVDQARQFVQLWGSLADAEMGEDGIDTRGLYATVLTGLEQVNLPPAEKWLESLRLAARAFEIGATRDPDAPPAPGALHQLMLDRYAGMSQAALETRLVNELTLAKRRTQMTFFRSNDWAGLAQATSEQDLVDRGLWLGSVQIDVVIANEGRADAFPHRSPGELSSLETQLSGLGREVVAKGWMMRERILQDEIKELDEEREDVMARLQTASDPQVRSDLLGQKSFFDIQIEQLETKIRDEKRAFGNHRVTIANRDFAGSCYVVRLTGTSPDTLGLSASNYTAWMRNGDALVSISLAGNFPPDEMTRAMDHFLGELSQRTSSY